ncbi:MAG: choice-of-anchor J domain-containing protein [Bacteroidetes bacterium]|nr:choice-of-anchor J domain-containing protein [Bacteroidota bacterium]
MKKIILLLFILSTSFYAKAQNDTLLYDNFDVDNSLDWATINSGNDTVWVSFDVDGLADANQRPQNWFWNPTAFAGNDTTGCVFSSSWLGPVVARCNNYFITPPVEIVDNLAVLNWRSAPRQTPSFLDGYEILVSTTDNYEASFTDTIFVAGEYVSGSGSSFDFSLFTFTSGFLHGADSTYVEFDPNSDSSSAVGLLRPFSVNLAQYSGQTIYIAFHHNSLDDNLIAVDDILVTGNLGVGINENELLISATLFPNPSTDRAHLRFNTSKAGNTNFNIYDVQGRIVKSQNMYLTGNAQEIVIPVGDLATGHYTLVAESNGSVSRFPMVIAK